MFSNDCPPVPSVERYKQAFLAIYDSLPDSYIEMLCAQYQAPNHAITATQAAEAAGYKHFSIANLHYGKMGTRLREELNYYDADDLRLYVLSRLEPPGAVDKEDYLWVMHPQVVQALEELGLCGARRAIRSPCR